MFVWLFHRISGAILIFLIGCQIVTGFTSSAGGTTPYQQFLVAWHKSPITVNIITVLFIFHSLFGIRTILVDLGLPKEKQLFWILTPIGVVLYIGFLLIFYVGG